MCSAFWVEFAQYQPTLVTELFPPHLTHVPILFLNFCCWEGTWIFLFAALVLGVFDLTPFYFFITFLCFFFFFPYVPSSFLFAPVEFLCPPPHPTPDPVKNPHTSIASLWTPRASPICPDVPLWLVSFLLFCDWALTTTIFVWHSMLYTVPRHHEPPGFHLFLGLCPTGTVGVVFRVLWVGVVDVHPCLSVVVGDPHWLSTSFHPPFLSP